MLGKMTVVMPYFHWISFGRIPDITLLGSWYHNLPKFVAVAQYEENDCEEIEVLCKDLKKNNLV